MAYTATQREQIYQFLGYRGTETDADLELLIDASQDGGATETTVVSILASIVAVEAAIAASGASSQVRGALKAVVGDAEFYDLPLASSRFLTTLEYGQLLIARLAARFGLEPDELPSQYFGPGPSMAAGIAGGATVTW